LSIDLPAARRAFTSYRGAPAGARAFVAARYVVAPLGPLAAEFRGRTGTVLSLGSGLSMLERYLAELEPGLHFEGVDLDPVKVELIARTHHLSPRVSLRLGDATRLRELEGLDAGSPGGAAVDPARTGSADAGGYDLVLICDAMHHFPADVHGDVLRSAAEVLRPGGTVVVKDLDAGPAWKYHWNRIHDRIVAGPDPIHCRPPADMAALVTAAGLVVERADRIDHALTPYAHYLIRATRPA
jgi:SAM-dependent methyltransferase